jgi:hypothetical protein
MNRAVEIRDAIDRKGSDLDAWPDRALASDARRAILADRGLRAWYDDSVALRESLAGARLALDVEIATSGAAARIEAALMGSLPRQGPRRNRWIAVAAALVVAAGLGSAYDLVVGSRATDAPINVVVLDPLVFGPAEVDTQ